MLIADHLVHIELHKTGCSHTQAILRQIPSLHSKVRGKHNPYYSVPNDVLGDFSSKVKVGNIRNPWDWYVSLWAFGCMQRGEVHARTSKLRLNKSSIKSILNDPSSIKRKPKAWEGVYADAYNPELFHKWLKLVLVDRPGDVDSDFGKSPLSEFSGLLTFRYLKLFTYNFHTHLKNISDLEKLTAFDQENNFIDVMIENKQIHQDLQKNTEKLQIPNAELKTVLTKFQKKTNPSKREAYQFYYDDASKHLIEERESFIIDKHHYQFDPITN